MSAAAARKPGAAEIAWSFLPFSGLSLRALYDLLQLREQVFMIEQQCLYAELDGQDAEALHLTGHVDGQLAVYARVFAPGHSYHGAPCPAARIGRVAVHEDSRGQGLGHAVMAEALARIARDFGGAETVVNAQAHLEGFYAAHGFAREGEPFDEDGIPHISMRRGP